MLDWSMTMLGYPAHRRGRLPVVGISHLSTHQALRLAEQLGIYTGWLVAETDQPHLENMVPGLPHWVALAELFVENRVANTTGVVSGSTVFAAAVPANGRPPSDRSLISWAEESSRPWVQIVDNEHAYWGGLSDEALDKLVLWFLNQAPLDGAWQRQSLHPQLAPQLRNGLFEHGWTRNGSLIRRGWSTTLELWGGIHERCVLDHDPGLPLGEVQTGLRLQLRGNKWRGEDLPGPCPLNDGSGRATPRP